MLAPRKSLQFILFAWFFVLSVVVWLAGRQPWTGVELRFDDRQGLLQVVQVAPGPADGKLSPGDRVRAIRTERGETLIANRYTTIVGPVSLSSYAAYNRFFERYRRLYQHYQATGRLVFELNDGRAYTIEPLPSTPLAQLPIEFWLLNVFGLFVVLIGGSIWSYRRRQLSTRLFLLSGIAFAVNTATVSVYGLRELLIEPGLFEFLVVLNRLAILVFAYAMAALFRVYPTCPGAEKSAWFVFGLSIPFWANQVFQLIEWPLHAHNVHLLVPLVLGVVFALQQWHNTRRDPVRRAVLKWFMLSIQLFVVIILIVWYIPPALGYQALASLTVANAVGLCVYIGIALGILRYRLFNLEKWWYETWIWTFGGLLVVVFDILLVAALQFSHKAALTVSVLVTGWIYFPLRQFIWSRLVKAPEKALASHFSDIMSTLISSGSSAQFVRQWPEILQRVFRPLKTRLVEGRLEQTKVLEEGMLMQVPSLESGRYVELGYAGRGSRLFTPADVEAGEALCALARRSLSLQEARQQGVSEERKRIMRDLHDDVAPTLMTAMHKTADEELLRLLRSAMQTLREVVYSLKNSDPGRRVVLDEALANWRAETGSRIESVGRGFVWSHPEDTRSIQLDIGKYLNIGRILREATTNAIKHGGSGAITITVSLDREFLTISVCDRNPAPLNREWIEGVGTASMKKRALEMNATIEWRHGGADSPGVCVALCCPVE